MLSKGSSILTRSNSRSAVAAAAHCFEMSWERHSPWPVMRDELTLISLWLSDGFMCVYHNSNIPRFCDDVEYL